MKAHETLPTLEEIRAFNASMRTLAQHQEAAPELKLAEDMEALQAAKLAKLRHELEEAEQEVARLSDVALDGYHKLEKEKEKHEALKQLIRDNLNVLMDGVTPARLNAAAALSEAVK